MTKGDLQAYRQQLQEMRRRLNGDMTHLADEALRKNQKDASGNLSSMPIHMADMGTDAFEQEFTLSLMEHDGSTLELIENALERIEDRAYGVCTDCEAKIPKQRLNVLPYTPHCVKCADKVSAR